LAGIPVRLRCRGCDFVDAQLVNISLSGALIRTETALTRFAPLEIELHGLVVPSFVVRVQSDGVGVEWYGRLPRVLQMAFLAQPPASNMERVIAGVQL
jgi:hypothetical protein